MKAIFGYPNLLRKKIILLILVKEIGPNKEDKKPGDNVHKKWWFDMKKLFFN